ncbi:MAG: sarcolemmal membrane-associated protein, partial [Candidatus Choladocola sp.]|nr:sarcolemmal membrane-associated protein [Candidatus Choladocola sp.]
KREKEQKKEKNSLAKQKRIERLEKKLIEVGYENLPESSLDLVHADLWLDSERLEELEQIRQQKIKKEQEKPVQLSLFDMM